LPELAPVGLAGAKVGLVGQGVIGTRVADVLGVLGCEVWASDPRGVPAGCRETSPDEMLVGCDAVSLHCDLNPSTLDLISAARLAVARPGLVLVNTARGGLLNIDAACAALDRGVLGALAIDVFSDEPFPEMGRVNGHPGLMFTPHAAGYHTGLAAAVRTGLCRAVGALSTGARLPHRVV
jgi:D-3-phosphoglycerate dehydrogenase